MPSKCHSCGTTLEAAPMSPRIRPRLTNQELRVRARVLDAEIARARAYLNQVLSEREMVQNDLDAIIYPVLTLPVEVTSQIFCWTLAKTGCIAFPYNFHLLGQSLHLGRICRLWRQIALSTPQLWNHMDFSINIKSDSRQTPSVSLIRTCLSRAASSPLSLFLALTTQINDEPVDQGVGPILDAFAPHSKMWENVGFCTTLNSLRALSGIHKHLPRLKSLKLGLLDWNAPETPITLFEEAPLLQIVHLISLHSQTVTLPWSQLTALHIEDISVGELWGVLGLTPNLVSLIIGYVYGDTNLWSLPPHLHLQSIVSTTLSSATYQILLFLTVPRLRDLKLALFHPQDNIAQLFTHTLDRLYIHVEGGNSARFPQYLATMPPSLRTAKIVLASGHAVKLGPLLSHLTDDPTFLPGLESLAITVLRQDQEHAPVTAHVLFNMLRTRRALGLQNFELVSFNSLPDTRLDTQMAGLVAEGMHIRVETQAEPYPDLSHPEF
ncbi:hypothetical protein B0H17DRAFT_1338829 [Mycena rosella]|uniref:F-box domain-containing protein n=1 Tax=Mycena rosella TaxID=1033263 RepID=A0AAD7FXM5_MYCRO|nr:hypothetical protein B0H17DRAFT_1338829 [Mycena rosella]